jgi:aryl-alcohol dehydrogenase-like predicted oxidoreductase
MKYRKLGNTGLFVSEISFGTWLTFGEQVRGDAADRLLRTALDNGINFFDTADVYAKGRAEELLGATLPQAARRQDYLIATKVYFPMGSGVNDRGLSRKHLFDSIHDSLRRLRQEYVDFYICHGYDTETPLVETIQAMQDLIHMGKIMHWGVCQWSPEQIAEASSKCKANGWTPPALHQENYSLLDRSSEHRILPVCSKHGLGFSAFSPLAQGILTGKYSAENPPTGSRAANDNLNMFVRNVVSDPDLMQRISTLGEIAHSCGVTSTTLSLAALLRQPDVSTLVAGASKPSQLRDLVQASGLELQEAICERLDELFAPQEQRRHWL